MPLINSGPLADDVLPTLLHVGVRFLIKSLLMFCPPQLLREFHFDAITITLTPMLNPKFHTS